MNLYAYSKTGITLSMTFVQAEHVVAIPRVSTEYLGNQSRSLIICIGKSFTNVEQRNHRQFRHLHDTTGVYKRFFDDKEYRQSLQNNNYSNEYHRTS
jgi:hypothetical protein